MNDFQQAIDVIREELTARDIPEKVINGWMHPIEATLTNDIKKPKSKPKPREDNAETPEDLNNG